MEITFSVLSFCHVFARSSSLSTRLRCKNELAQFFLKNNYIGLLRGLKSAIRNASPIKENKLNNRGRKLTCFYGGTEGFISETIRESEITRIPSSNCDFFHQGFSYLKIF